MIGSQEGSRDERDRSCRRTKGSGSRKPHASLSLSGGIDNRKHTDESAAHENQRHSDPFSASEVVKTVDLRVRLMSGEWVIYGKSIQEGHRPSRFESRTSRA